VFTHLCIGDSTIKVFIHLSHQLEDLLLSDRESHTLKHVVELVYFDVVILIIIDLVKDLLQSQTSLL